MKLSDALLDGDYLQDEDLAPGVKVGLILLTPGIAADLLKRVPQRQRKKSPRVVNKYVTDLASSKWPFLADVIRLNTNDELIDGQHRCEAVVQTGNSIPTLIAVGLDNEAIVPMDSGKGRRFEDLLDMEEHISNSQVVASLTRRSFHWMVGNYGQENVARVISPTHANQSPTNEQLWTVYKAMKSPLIDSTRHGMSIGRYFSKSAGAPIFGFSWLLLGAYDLDLREKLFGELRNGSIDQGPEYPINQLRRVLTKNWVGEKKPKAWEWQHYIFQTWNRLVEGETTGLRRPSYPAWNTVAKPIDPHAEVRPAGWEPIPNLFVTKEYA